ncbi:acetyl-CoA synthetase-like protein [Atractiella rhizophila]|nr:acetyl-CoA synthetase-like protein [Atractiella rhizophila]
MLASTEDKATAAPGSAPVRRSFLLAQHNKSDLISTPSDGSQTVYEVLQSIIRRSPDVNGIASRKILNIIEEQKEVGGKTKTWKYFELGPYEWLTYKQFGDRVRIVASALRTLGLDKDTRFNIYNSTGLNWQTLAIACSSQSIVFSTSYDSLGEEGLQHSINEPEVTGVFTHSSLLGTLAKVLPNCPTVKVIIYDGPEDEVPAGALEKLKAAREGIKVVTLDEVEKMGKEKEWEPVIPKHQDLCCIMYTSGSTGAPKGVLLTHENVVASVGAVEFHLGHLLKPGLSYLAYLPLAHVMEFVIEVSMLYLGVSIGFGTVKTLTDTSVRNCLGDIREFKPSILVGVPAVWELIRKGITGRVKSGGALKERVFNLALGAKRLSKYMPFGINPLGMLADMIVFKQVRQATGGQLQYAMNGGAPLSGDTQEFLNIALVTMLQGYGLTESCGMCAVLTPTFYQYGTVGPPMPSVEVRLKDVEEAGYFATNTPAQGEIWIRGPSVTKGYFKREDLTKEAFSEDGWFMTGDIGQWNKDGTLSIIDRKKNLIKLSGGEYVALERLESIYKSASTVGNICVHATSSASKPMAIIFVHEANLKHLVNKSESAEELVKEKDVNTAVLNELNAVGKKAGLKPLETLQCVVLTAEEWTPQNGLLTAAQKLQRKQILNHYKKEIDLQHSINEPEVTGVFTHSSLLGTLAKVLPHCPTVKVIIYDGPEDEVPAGALEKLKAAREGIQVVTLDEVEKMGKEKEWEPVIPKHQDLCCIMYTSGSTGAPKGVLLTHENVVASVGAVEFHLGHLLKPGLSYLAYLPLAHVMEFVIEVSMLYLGVSIGFGTVKTLTDTSVRNCLGDIREFKPSILVGVPAVWELIRKGITGRVKSGGALKERVFNLALGAKRLSKYMPFGINPLGMLADMIVFKQVRQATGGQLQYAMNGGAPLSGDTQEFLNIALVTMLQGYGLTESCGMCAVLTPTFYQYGTVGPPMPSVEVRLKDVEEAGYFATNTPAQGEIWIRGPSVTKGYFKREDLTKEAFSEDGWFMTGDIGQWNKDGTLSIIDRKKNLIKLSGGEYVALERLESIYKSASTVGNICVHATSSASKPMAIIFVHEANLKHLVNKSESAEELVKEKDVNTAVLNELNAVGKKAGLKPLETLQCVVLTAEEWTPQNGLLTAAQKLQRKQILNHYKKEIDAVYP